MKKIEIESPKKKWAPACFACSPVVVVVAVSALLLRNDMHVDGSGHVTSQPPQESLEEERCKLRATKDSSIDGKTTNNGDAIAPQS